MVTNDIAFDQIHNILGNIGGMVGNAFQLAGCGEQMQAGVDIGGGLLHRCTDVVDDLAGAFFRRLRKRKKYNVAVIATARKLVTIAYLMLKNNEPYRYAKLAVVKDKFTDCRRKAQKTAPKQNKKSAKPLEGSPLNNLYREHGLPTCQSPKEWSAGERRALVAAEVSTFAEDVHTQAKSRTRKRTRVS